MAASGPLRTPASVSGSGSGSFLTGLGTTVAAALAGIALGIVLRPSAAAIPAEMVSISPPPSASLPAAKKPPPPHHPRLAAVLAAGTPCAQAAAALGLLEIDSVEEIKAIFRETASFPAHAARGSVLAALFTRWLELDSQGAADHCRRQHPDLQAQLLATWTLTDAAAATAWLDNQPDDEFHSTWNLRCRLAVDQDPDKAWKMLEKSPGLPGEYSGYGTDDLLKSLVKKNVDAAIARLDTMAPALQPAARQEIVRQLMSENPVRAWAWLAGQRGMPNPLEGWIEGNGGAEPEAAAVIQRIESLPDADGLVHTAKGAALAEWLHTNPEMAVSLMKSQHPVPLWDMLNNHPLQPLKMDEAAALVEILKRAPFRKLRNRTALPAAFSRTWPGTRPSLFRGFSRCSRRTRS